MLGYIASSRLCSTSIFIWHARQNLLDYQQEHSSINDLTWYL